MSTSTSAIADALPSADLIPSRGFELMNKLEIGLYDVFDQGAISQNIVTDSMIAETWRDSGMSVGMRAPCDACF